MPNPVHLGRLSKWLCIAVLAAGWISPTFAEEIDGVQPVAIDQPRINLVVRRTANGPVLSAKGAAGETFNIEAFLDTGASGVVFSTHTADQLAIQREHSAAGNYSEARFTDIGVGGGSLFAISEPVFLSLAPESPSVNVDQKEAIATTYLQNYGPIRGEIGPVGSITDYLLSLALGDMDIAGTPVMQGKVIVLDTKDVNALSDKIRTFVYDAPTASAPEPMIPKTNRHVQLSFSSFDRFTKTTPAGVSVPTLFPNPFIGPNPLKPAGDSTPPIVAGYGGKKSSGTWLLDSGAAASMISLHQAAALGVHYVAGTNGTDSPLLAGIAPEKQFTLTIGGIGGTKKAAGFFLDELTLTTQEGKPITFRHAPVLVADITVRDPASGEQFTLDGVFGMNFLVASASLDESSLLPDIDKISPGAFRWIVIDFSKGLLGVELQP